MNPRIQALLQQGSQWWQARAPRERLALAAALTTLVCASYYLGVSSLQQKIVRLERQLPELMQQSFEISASARPQAQAPVARGADLRSELFRILAEREVLAELRALSATRVEMRLPPQPGSNLLASLQAIRLASGARVESLQLRNGEDKLSEATVILERQP